MPSEISILQMRSGYQFSEVFLKPHPVLFIRKTKILEHTHTTNQPTNKKPELFTLTIFDFFRVFKLLNLTICRRLQECSIQML
jgi:hypothetical protein